MECIIKIVDGVPFEHPIILDNFVSAYPELDLNNLPPEWAKFERLAEEKAIKRAWGDALVAEDRQSLQQYGEEQKALVEEHIKPVWQAWIDQIKAYTYDDPWPLQNHTWPRMPPAVIIQYPDPE